MLPRAAKWTKSAGEAPEDAAEGTGAGLKAPLIRVIEAGTEGTNGVRDSTRSARAVAGQGSVQSVQQGVGVAVEQSQGWEGRAGAPPGWRNGSALNPGES